MSEVTTQDKLSSYAAGFMKAGKKGLKYISKKLNEPTEKAERAEKEFIERRKRRLELEQKGVDEEWLDKNYPLY